jgi:menaquinone-dependent protoporphyrinogen IX oxidase
VQFTRWAVSLDSESFEILATASLFSDAIAAISAAGNAAVRKGIAETPWQFASAVTVAGLLRNTTSFWPDP